MKRSILFSTFIGILVAWVFPYSTMAQIHKPERKPQEKTVIYTHIITEYPKGVNKEKAWKRITVMKYWVKGDRWRMDDITFPKSPRITIVSGGWSYFLIPETKTGTKTKVIKQLELPPDNPTKLLMEWKKKGAKKIGSEKLNGQECDVYEKRPSKEREPRVRIWVRKKDNVVIKMEEDPKKSRGVIMGEDLKKFLEGGIKERREVIKLFKPIDVIVIHEFKDIKIGVPIDDSLFIVPKDYKLEEMP